MNVRDRSPGLRLRRGVRWLVPLLLATPTFGAVVIWELKQDPSTPGTRFWHSAVYDEVRRVTVVFGGLKGPTLTGEMWGWDGAAWTLLTPEKPGDPDVPSPRYGAAMAYYTKPAGQGDGILLFGGIDAGNVPLGDTFEWNGATRTWKKLAPATAPSPRYAAAMAYDPGSGNVVLFGGADQGATGLSPNDTWAWNGTSWTKINSGIPPPRAAHGFAYDETRKKLVLYGGFASLLQVLGDTWELDATGWHQRCQPTPCAIPPRFLHGLAYDRQQQRMLMFGGSDTTGQMHGDAWLWNGSNWTGITPGGGGGARTGQVVAFDAARNRMVLFGGRSVGQDLADTREALFAGQPCSGPAACNTGLCVDRVCCRTTCTGTCRRCDLPNPLFKVLFGVDITDGVCRVPSNADPDRDCLGDSSCAGVCGFTGRCTYADAEKTCGLCAACNRATGKCDRLPASGDDVNCPPARCDLASNPCRTFEPQSVGIRRCLEVGKCGWRWLDCSSFQDHDGEACIVFPDDNSGQESKIDGRCSKGLCLPP